MKNEIFTGLFALSTLIIVILFYKNIWLAFFLLFLVAVIGLATWKSRRTLFVFILGALFGSGAEIIAVHYNVWNYSVINFVNIPFWLTIVWGNAAMFIYQIAISIKEKKLQI